MALLALCTCKSRTTRFSVLLSGYGIAMQKMYLGSNIGSDHSRDCALRFEEDDGRWFGKQARGPGFRNFSNFQE